MYTPTVRKIHNFFSLAEIERQVNLLSKMREDSTSGFAAMAQEAEALVDEQLEKNGKHTLWSI